MGLDKNQSGEESESTEVRLVVFASSDSSLDKISTYLKRKDFTVVESYNLNDFLSKLSSNQFDAAFVCVDILEGNLLRLPELLFKAFNLESIAISLSNDRKQQGKLRQITATQKVHGIASGMGCFTALKKLFAPKDDDIYSQKSGSKNSKGSSSIKVSGSGSLKEQMIMQRNNRSETKSGDESVKKQLLKMAENNKDKAIQNKAHIEKSVSDNKTKSSGISDPKEDKSKNEGHVEHSVSENDTKRAQTKGVNTDTNISPISSGTSDKKANLKEETKNNKDQPSDLEKASDKSLNSQKQSENKIDKHQSEQSVGNNEKNKSTLAKDSKTTPSSSKEINKKTETQMSVPETAENKNTLTALEKDSINVGSKESVIGKVKPTEVRALNNGISKINLNETSEQFLYSVLVKKDDANELYFLTMNTKLINEEDRCNEVKRILQAELEFSNVQYTTELSPEGMVKLSDYSLGINKKQISTENEDISVEYTDKVESLSLPKIINEQMALINVENIPTEIKLGFSIFLYLEKNMKYYRLIKPENNFSVDLKTRLIVADKSIYIQTDEIKDFYKDFCLSMYAKIQAPGEKNKVA